MFLLILMKKLVGEFGTFGLVLKHPPIDTIVELKPDEQSYCQQSIRVNSGQVISEDRQVLVALDELRVFLGRAVCGNFPYPLSLKCYN